MNGYQKRFCEIMAKSGRHTTRQRVAIAGTLYAMKGHPTIEELYATLQEGEPNIGLATIYRTVKLLKDAGLVMELYGDEGAVRLEAVDSPKHHDHFICRNCGTVTEVYSPELEKAQHELAQKYGFSPEAQAHSIYGLCFACHAGQQ